MNKLLIFSLLLSSCVVEYTECQKITVANHSGANVRLHFVSGSFSPVFDSIVQIANEASFQNEECGTGGASIHAAYLFTGTFDTCHIIFNDTLRITYVWLEADPRNILNIDNFSRTTSETKHTKSIYDTYTLTPDDLANAEPF